MKPEQAAPDSRPAPALRPVTPPILRVVERLAEAADLVASASLVALVLAITAIVVFRNAFKVGLVEIDDGVRYLLIWLVFLAAVGLTLRGDHIAMDALYARMKPRWRMVMRALYGVTGVVMSAFMAWVGWQQAAQVLASGERSSSGAWPAIIGYGALPLGFLLMTITSLCYVLYRVRSEDSPPGTPEEAGGDPL